MARLRRRQADSTTMAVRGSEEICSGIAGLSIYAVATPENADRASVRQLVRQVLRQILVRQLGVELAAISLISIPGQPLRLAPPFGQIGLSLSHENGRSLIAFHRHGPVGIDLLKTGPALPDLARLAEDFLGPQMAARIAALPVGFRQPAFERDWTRLEAQLKCAGLGLSEWSPARDQALVRCDCTELSMPDGWTAAVAVSAR